MLVCQGQGSWSLVLPLLCNSIGTLHLNDHLPGTLFPIERLQAAQASPSHLIPLI